ncbi:ABC transporter permease [Janibacter limosus]|uniref:ABC transporter permease n=1 Tax=Janibacter limosus TaxID=53458 RepID=A0A4P6MVG4_9MICO|nr:ABC transporter permease [Janibacter limosus]QBF46926.1 ABC transporter permease [Janibacter limosus]
MSTPPRGVIHDLGYRGFDGRRLGDGAITLELYRNSVAQAFGIGRSGKAKIMPWLVILLMAVPAVVLGAISIQAGQAPPEAEMGAPSTYFAYPYWTQLLITIFVATQAPVLFARDLRYRTIVLYFARPVSRTRFVLTRLAALTTAIFVVIVGPMLVWFACALSTGHESGLHAQRFGAAVVGVAVLSLVLAALAGLVSTLATKSGLALAAIIVVLMVPSAMITMALAITTQLDNDGVGQLIASAHPFTAVALLVSGIFGDPPVNPTIPQPHGWLIGFAVAVCVAWVLLPVLALVARIRSVASL